MASIGLVGCLLLVLIFIVSYKGFTNLSFFHSYKFEVDKILVNKEYIRLISSGFLHADWLHLIFNCISLLAFSGALELHIGMLQFTLIYFASLIGGNLLALYIHRHHGDYSAIGASGAVSGIIFACIALYPGMDISVFVSFLRIPSWLYALLFIAWSLYGIKSQKDNIGHEAHLGGGLVGMLFALLLYPKAIFVNYIPIAIVFIPSVLFIYLIFTRPGILLQGKFFQSTKKYYNIDEKYNDERNSRQEEIDKLLEKISKKGVNSLSQKEKDRLDELSGGR